MQLREECLWERLYPAVPGAPLQGERDTEVCVIGGGYTGLSTGLHLAQAGRRVVVLVSGDPFWHGAGGTVAGMLPVGAWRAFPAPGTFSLVAARLGWRIEDTACLGLHAAPFARLRPFLAPGWRGICTLRDGANIVRARACDISQGGIKVETSSEFGRNAEVVVSLPGLPPQPGVVRWMADGYAGITFNRLLPLPQLIDWLKARSEARNAA